MNKTSLMIMVAALAASAFGQNIYVARSDDKTSEDLPLTYEAEQTLWDGQDVHMVGKVKNTGGSSYAYVKVTFTASKGGGTFVARDYSYTDPKDIGPGQVGYVDMWIRTDGVKPDNVKWVLTGHPK